MSNHSFHSRDGKNQGLYTLWARVDEHGNTMYQIYQKFGIDMTKEGNIKK